MKQERKRQKAVQEEAEKMQENEAYAKRLFEEDTISRANEENRENNLASDDYFPSQYYARDLLY